MSPLQRLLALRRRWLAQSLPRRWAASAVVLVVALTAFGLWVARPHPDEEEARRALQAAPAAPRAAPVDPVTSVDAALGRLLPVLLRPAAGDAVRAPTAAEARAIDPKGALRREHGAAPALARGVRTAAAGRVWVVPARDGVCVALEARPSYRTSCASLPAVRKGLLQVARIDGRRDANGVPLLIVGVAPTGVRSVPVLARRLPVASNVYAGTVRHPSMSPDPNARPSDA